MAASGNGDIHRKSTCLKKKMNKYQIGRENGCKKLRWEGDILLI